MSIERLESTPLYSKIVVSNDSVHLAGLVATDAQGDIEHQSNDIFGQIDTLLARAGSNKSQLLSMNVWIKDFADYRGFNASYERWIDSRNLPARATVRADLFDPRLRIEIMCIAARPAAISRPSRAEDLMAHARANVDMIGVTEAIRLHADGSAEFVDVRETHERSEKGMIPGSVHAARGMLEFHIDPNSSFSLPVFTTRKRIVFVCGSGGRALLSAETARAMGVTGAVLEGGMKAWIEARGPLTTPA